MCRSCSRCSCAALHLRLAVAGVALEGTRRREFAELVAHHLLGDEHGNVLTTAAHRDRVPDHLGEDRRCARPGAHHPLLVLRVHVLDPAHQPLLDERPLLRAAAHLALLLSTTTATGEQPVRFLVLLAHALAERRHAPRCDWVATALRLTLAAAVRMVDRVHRRPADGGTLALPAAAAGLADGHVLVVDVTDLPDRRAAGQRHAAHFAGREPEHAVPVVLRDELDTRPGAPRHLPALAGLQLDVVHERSGRDVLERERVAGPDVCAGAGLDRRAHTQSRRREDVRLRAVGVMEQRDPRRPVRVVLDRGDLRRHAVLLALEVDHAVTALVPTALVARRDASVVVPAALLGQLLGQRLL